MRDIARLAGGVHPSTVSLALRNSPEISAATRKRIHAVARRLGYHPDPLLDAFNIHRLQILPRKAEPVLAWVTDHPTLASLQASPADAALWAAAQQAASLLHCRLDPFFLGPGALTAHRLDSVLAARGLTAAILACLSSRSPQPALDWTRLAAVRIESLRFDSPGYVVATDHRNSLRTALAQMRSRGCRRIGLLLEDSVDAPTAELLASGFLPATPLDENPAGPPVLHLEGGPGAGALIEPWITDHGLDGILTTSPDYPSLVSTRAIPPARELPWACLRICAPSPRVAGMVPRWKQLAEQAVEQLVSLLRTNQHGPPSSPSCTYVSARWQNGSSLPAPRRLLDERLGLRVVPADAPPARGT